MLPPKRSRDHTKVFFYIYPGGSRNLINIFDNGINKDSNLSSASREIKDLSTEEFRRNTQKHCFPGSQRHDVSIYPVLQAMWLRLHIMCALSTIYWISRWGQISRRILSRSWGNLIRIICCGRLTTASWPKEETPTYG